MHKDRCWYVANEVLIRTHEKENNFAWYLFRWSSLMPTKLNTSDSSTTNIVAKKKKKKTDFCVIMPSAFAHAFTCAMMYSCACFCSPVGSTLEDQSSRIYLWHYTRLSKNLKSALYNACVLSNLYDLKFLRLVFFLFFQNKKYAYPLGQSRTNKNGQHPFGVNVILRIRPTILLHICSSQLLCVIIYFESADSI